MCFVVVEIDRERLSSYRMRMSRYGLCIERERKREREREKLRQRDFRRLATHTHTHTTDCIKLIQHVDLHYGKQSRVEL